MIVHTDHAASGRQIAGDHRVVAVTRRQRHGEFGADLTIGTDDQNF